MKLLKILALLALAGVAGAAPSNPPAGNFILNVSTFGSAQAVNITSATIRQQLYLPFATANQCLQTDILKNVVSAACLSGGGGSGSSLLINQNSVAITSPTLAVNALSPPFLVTAVGAGTTAQWALDPSSVTLMGNNVNGTSQLVETDFAGALPALSAVNLTNIPSANLSGPVSAANLSNAIILQNTLQTGATFYVSSGTLSNSSGYPLRINQPTGGSGPIYQGILFTQTNAQRGYIRQDNYNSQCSDLSTTCQNSAFEIGWSTSTFLFNQDGRFYASQGASLANAYSSVIGGSLIVGGTGNKNYTDTQRIGDGNLFVNNGVTASTVSLNGVGDGKIDLVIGVSTYAVTSTSTPATNVTGHMAVWSGTTTLVDGGVPGTGGGAAAPLSLDGSSSANTAFSVTSANNTPVLPLVNLSLTNSAATSLRPILNLANTGRGNAISIQNTNSVTSTANCFGSHRCGAIDVDNSGSTGYGMVIHTSTGNIGNTETLFYVLASSPSYSGPVGIFESSSTSGQGGIRIRTPQPDIEFIESDQDISAGKGRWDLNGSGGLMRWLVRDTGGVYNTMFAMTRRADGGPYFDLYSTGTLRFMDRNNINYSGIKSSDTMAFPMVLVLPSSTGTVGNLLTNLGPGDTTNEINVGWGQASLTSGVSGILPAANLPTNVNYTDVNQTVSGVRTYSSSATFNDALKVSSGVYLGASSGSSGQVLTSAGPGIVPTWTSPAGASAATIAVTAGVARSSPTSDVMFNPLQFTGSVSGSSITITNNGAVVINSVSASYTATSTDSVIGASAVTTTTTITLDAATTLKGQRLSIFKTDASSWPVTVVCAGADKINGSTGTFTLNARGQSISITSDGVSSWLAANLQPTPFAIPPMTQTIHVNSAVKSSSTSYLSPDYVPVPTRITGCRFVVNVQGGMADCGIYDSNGVLLSSTTPAIVGAITTVQTLNFITPVNLSPGTYYKALSSGNPAITFNAFNCDWNCATIATNFPLTTGVSLPGTAWTPVTAFPAMQLIVTGGSSL